MAQEERYANRLCAGRRREAAVFEHGAGPELLVLVHGYRSSGRSWRLVQEALDATRFRSLALSNRGAGDSERTMEVATRYAGVLDRFVSQTVLQCLAAGRSAR